MASMPVRSHSDPSLDASPAYSYLACDDHPACNPTIKAKSAARNIPSPEFVPRTLVTTSGDFTDIKLPQMYYVSDQPSQHESYSARDKNFYERPEKSTISWETQRTGASNTQIPHDLGTMPNLESRHIQQSVTAVPSFYTNNTSRKGPPRSQRKKRAPAVVTAKSLPAPQVGRREELLVRPTNLAAEGWQAHALLEAGLDNREELRVIQEKRRIDAAIAVHERKPDSPVDAWHDMSPKPPAGPRDRNNDTEVLDSTYIQRNLKFFTIGKVFAILHTEPYGDHPRGKSSNVFTVKYGEKVHSQIMRYVVVQSGRGFCYACPISTYGGRATLKRGCNPSEHSIVYLQKTMPVVLKGEHLTKEPIEVIPSSLDIKLDPASRIRFGRGDPIQYNVKAKDIGHVVDGHLSLITRYWREEMGMEAGKHQTNETPIGSFDNEVGTVRTFQSEEGRRNTKLKGDWTIIEKYHGTRTGENETANEQQMKSINAISGEITLDTISPEDFSNPTYGPYTVLVNNLEFFVYSEVGKQLHSGFESIRKPKSFFKRGRIFMILYPELVANVERTVYWKIRRFVVVRSRKTHCLCLPMSTYQGQATSKAGVVVEDHAPVVPVGGEVELHPDEKHLSRSPLYIKPEDPSISIDPTSRINFARIYPIDYASKVRRIGRIIQDSLGLLEQYLAETLKLSE